MSYTIHRVQLKKRKDAIATRCGNCGCKLDWEFHDDLTATAYCCDNVYVIKPKNVILEEGVLDYE